MFALGLKPVLLAFRATRLLVSLTSEKKLEKEIAANGDQKEVKVLISNSSDRQRRFSEEEESSMETLKDSHQVRYVSKEDEDIRLDVTMPLMSLTEGALTGRMPDALSLAPSLQVDRVKEVRISGPAKEVDRRVAQTDFASSAGVIASRTLEVFNLASSTLSTLKDITMSFV